MTNKKKRTKAEREHDEPNCEIMQSLRCLHDHFHIAYGAFNKEVDNKVAEAVLQGFGNAIRNITPRPTTLEVWVAVLAFVAREVDFIHTSADILDDYASGPVN